MVFGLALLMGIVMPCKREGEVREKKNEKEEGRGRGREGEGEQRREREVFQGSCIHLTSYMHLYGTASNQNCVRNQKGVQSI